jgi:serine phosphatase RsbU (regulator of sigma subunit)
LILYFAKRLYSSSRYYSAASTSLGLLIFSSLFYFFTSNSIPLFLFALLFAFVIIKILIYLCRFKYRKIIEGLLATLMLIFSLRIITLPVKLSLSEYFPIFLVFFLITATICGTIAVIKNIGNKYRNKALLILLLASVSGLIIPFALVLPMLYYDFPIPISFTSLLTVIAPIVIGKTLIEKSQISELISRKLNSYHIIIDIITSIFIALFLTGLLLMNHIYGYMYIPILFAVLNISLIGRSFIINRSSHPDGNERDLQTSSLQRIIETSVRPIDFSERIARIYREISLFLDVEAVELAVFESEQTKSLVSSNSITILEKTNPIVEHFHHGNDIIKRDLLYNSHIDDYMSLRPETDRYYLIVPIFFRNVIKAVFFLTQKNRRTPYFKNEYDYVSTAGAIIFQTIENEALLHHSLIRTKYEQELDNASYVQMRLFPVYIPAESGLELSLYTRPYNKVTGDYVDIVKLDQNRTAIIIGDITGHGLPAAMLHSTTSTLITALFKQEKTLSDIFYAINDFLINKYRGYELITMFGAIFDRNETSIEYINAGHPPIYVMHPEKETFIRIESKGHILGVTNEAEYESQKMSLLHKSQLFFFTDGLTEIKKERVDSNIGEEFLEKILHQLLKEPMEKKVEELTYFISGVDSNCISDDITIAGVEVL